MPGAPVPIGPWPGGLNISREPSTISDEEVAEALNLEFLPDGSAISRPAILTEWEPSEDDEEGGVPTGELQQLGFYVRTTGKTELVVAAEESTWLYDVDTKEWTQIWDHRATGFTQYLENAVLISTEEPGGYWDGDQWHDTPTMPLGAQIVFYQERFWAFGAKNSANANRVWFSNLTVISPASTIWDWTTATDFFEVGPGDGQWITGLVSDSSALIIFRNLSTWVFTFPADPGDGTLRRISGTTGADLMHCVVPYEGYYFVFNQGHLYQFISYQFYAVDQNKVVFRRQPTPGTVLHPYRLSVLGERIVVWYLGETLVYNVASSTWSRWRSESSWLCHFAQRPPTSEAGDYRTGYGISGVDGVGATTIFRVQEEVPQLAPGETFTCVLTTKAHAFEQPSRFKRQTMWTVEVASADGVDGYMYPRVLSGDTVDWDTLETVDWDTLDQGNWDNPLVVSAVIIDPVSYPAQAPVRELIKLHGPRRFLRVEYEVRKEIDGTSRTSPFRIYTMTAYLMMRGKTRDKVS